MKLLTAEEFAAKVMENGSELEYVDDTTVDVYAHIDYYGNLVNGIQEAEWTIKASIKLDGEDQYEALMNREMDDVEKQVIIDDLYDQYLEIIKENVD